MFDPINAPDVHRGPATGHSTEWGTTWHEAVKRINDAFKALFETASTGVAPDFVAALDARFKQAEDKITFLEEALSDALFKVDSHAAIISALTAPADPDGKPATDAQPAV